MFMVVVHVDASKWPVVVLMKDSDAMHTVETLRESGALHGRWPWTMAHRICVSYVSEVPEEQHLQACP